MSLHSDPSKLSLFGPGEFRVSRKKKGDQMRSLIILSMLLTSISFGAEIKDAKLKNSIEQVSVHVEAIEKEAKRYLEGTTTVVESEEKADVLIRKLALKKSQEKNDRLDFFGNKSKAKMEKEEQNELNQALENNNMMKLKTVVLNDLTVKKKSIVRETASLLIEIASGSQTSRDVTRTEIVNGKVTTLEIEQDSYEVRRLKKLAVEYSETKRY